MQDRRPRNLTRQTIVYTFRLVRYEWDPANFSLESQQTPKVTL